MPDHGAGARCCSWREESTIEGTAWRAARLVVAALVLAALGWRLGAAPFVEGLRLVTWQSVVAAGVLTAASTWCAARRWSLVSERLGLDLPLPRAIGAYYRSQFLNATLPGGVVGDVHRGYRHGSESADLGRGLRAVAWERTAGQVMQGTLTVAAVLTLATPLRGTGVVLGLLVVLVIAAAVVIVTRARGGVSRRARLARAVSDDLRRLRAGPAALLGILATSAGAVAGHVAVFLVAAHAAGLALGPTTLVPVALVVLLVATLPTNIAGWGPREGAAAGAFVAVGATAAEGVTTAVVYGVIALLATAPGAVLLLRDTRPSTRSADAPQPGGVPAHG